MKEKLPTYIVVHVPHDLWSRFMDTIPVLIFILLLVAFGIWFFDKYYAQWMNGKIDYFDQRTKDLERKIEKIDRALADNNHWIGVVDGLVDEVAALKGAMEEKDPLKVIDEDEGDLDR